MPVLGVTGGVATGKSTFVQALLRYLPGKIFDADASAHELLRGNAEVIASVREIFGAGVFDRAGLRRDLLREVVFRDGALRKRLEELLHPPIRAAWLAAAQTARESKSWLFADIPLLFETDAASFVDRSVVVACSPAAQEARLREIRGLSAVTIPRMVAAQLGLDEKMRRADHIIWNDAALKCLERQTALFASWLNHHYG